MTVSRILLALLVVTTLPAYALCDETTEIQAGPRALSKAFREAARKATPSVVTVFTYGQPTATQAESGDPPTEEQLRQKLTGLGSGVIVSAEGRVITNNHVIRGAKRVEVHLPDESEYEVVEVLGDPDSDIAVLKIERDEPFDYAEIGDSDTLETGDWVLAIGSPFRLEATVSAGIISAKNRRLDRLKRIRVLQTDAAINPGNSGGPLIDLNGEVIGISTAIATRSSGYQGVGFAVPVNQAKWIANELAEHGRVRRAAIGITMAELNPKVASKVKLTPWMGVLAYQIIEDSVAKRAGLKRMDVILEFAGEKVRDPAALRALIEQKPIGSKQEVKIYRKGDELTLKIELAPADDPTAGKSAKDADEKVKKAEEVKDDNKGKEDKSVDQKKAADPPQ